MRHELLVLPCRTNRFVCCDCPDQTFNDAELHDWVRIIRKNGHEWLFQKAGFFLSQDTLVRLLLNPDGFHLSSDTGLSLPFTQELKAIGNGIAEARARSARTQKNYCNNKFTSLLKM